MDIDEFMMHGFDSDVSMGGEGDDANNEVRKKHTSEDASRYTFFTF